MPMTYEYAEKVRVLALEVAEAAEAAINRAREIREADIARRRMTAHPILPSRSTDNIGPTRESGALRRRSMDLTRALADLRRGL